MTFNGVLIYQKVIEQVELGKGQPYEKQHCIHVMVFF